MKCDFRWNYWAKKNLNKIFDNYVFYNTYLEILTISLIFLYLNVQRVENHISIMIENGTVLQFHSLF